MGTWKKLVVHVAWSGLLASGFSVLPLSAQEVAVPETEKASPSNQGANAEKIENKVALSELPDSPGATVVASTNSPQQGTIAQTPNNAPAPQSAQPQANPSQSTQPPPQQPVGTAASEAPRATGVAASQPAGVAIAPAKQRRVRTIVIRVGAIVGAAVAVGAVVALTAGTPSKPPGAH